MGFFDFFKRQVATGVDVATEGRCDQCAYSRGMPMFIGSGVRNVFVCELSRRDDDCVRQVRPDEVCSRFKSN